MKNEYRYVSTKTQKGRQILGKEVLEATVNKNVSLLDWARICAGYGNMTQTDRNFMIPVK